MQPATIRRLLVFGVCLVGVAGLYLLPGPAGVGSAGQRDRPTAPPSVATVVSVTTPALTPGTLGTVAATPTARFPSAVDFRTGQSGAGRPAPRPLATAGQPGRDQTPPRAVGPLTVTTVDTEHLGVSWPAATDDVGVVSYQVWLNGFLVLSTQQQRASLAWFNDTGTHVVQVRAIDASGNAGGPSPILLVVRPSPNPVATAPPPTSISQSPGSRPTDQEDSS